MYSLCCIASSRSTSRDLRRNFAEPALRCNCSEVQTQYNSARNLPAHIPQPSEVHPRQTHGPACDADNEPVTHTMGYALSLLANRDDHLVSAWHHNIGPLQTGLLAHETVLVQVTIPPIPQRSEDILLQHLQGARVGSRRPDIEGRPSHAGIAGEQARLRQGTCGRPFARRARASACDVFDVQRWASLSVRVASGSLSISCPAPKQAQIVCDSVPDTAVSVAGHLAGGARLESSFLLCRLSKAGMAARTCSATSSTSRWAPRRTACSSQACTPCATSTAQPATACLAGNT